MTVIPEQLTSNLTYSEQGHSADGILRKYVYVAFDFLPHCKKISFEELG